MKIQGLSADFILRNGTVITVDNRDMIAEAVAVKDGIIIRVGANKDMAPLIGEKTKVIDITGKTVVPGFIDGHVHNLSLGEWSNNPKVLNMDTSLNPLISDLLRRVWETAKETPKGTLIGGKFFNPYTIKDRRWPTREELDASAPENPVIITIRGGHCCVVNRMALELVGITRDTPNPEGGVIEKDPVTGEPTGLLRDVVALLRPVLPQATIEDYKNSISTMSKQLVSTGVTSTGDGGAAPRPESYRAYQEALADGSLKTRTYLMIREQYYRNNDLGLRTGFGNDKLRLGPVKLFVDGDIQCFTCAFYEPYVTKNTRGLEGLRYNQKGLNQSVAEAHKLGYQVAMHVQGDYGITVAVNAIEYAMEKYPRPDPRHRIEHALCPTMTDLERMKNLGIIADFLLFIPWFWGDPYINYFIGEERTKKMVPIKTAMKMGVISCAHSDCPGICAPNDPVWPSNPLWGMWCAMNRKTLGGIDIGPQEKLTPMEALRVYTINGAYSSFEENIKGSIEAGKLADMVLLSDNPLKVDPWEIRNITVEKTIIGGEIVYEKALS